MTTAHEQTHHHLSDLLARLAATRDPEAWTALLVTAGPEMQRLARRVLGEAALADDALQEALLQIRDHADQFRSTGSGDPDRDARRWILRVTTNSCISIFRSRARSKRREREHGGERPILPTPHEAMEQSEQADLLRRELALLPTVSSTAIILHHLGGLSFEEIAAELGQPIGTAKTNVRRGLMALRQRLQRVGVVMSISAVAGSLTALSAAEGAAPLLGYASLLYSPIKAATAASATVMGLGVKAVVIGFIAAASLGIGTAVVSLSRPTATAVAPPVTLASTGSVIMSFDFEDGIQHAVWSSGIVEVGPPRPGNRFCLAGEDNAELLSKVKLEAGEGNLLFEFVPGMTMTFDYWVEDGIYSIDFYGWNDSEKNSFGDSNILVSDHGTWVHASVSLDAFSFVEEGDRVRNIVLQASQKNGAMYIDNLKFTR
jgi:RNA polymerase sigma-70 factor (ECF subfamily)